MTGDFLRAIAEHQRKNRFREAAFLVIVGVATTIVAQNLMWSWDKHQGLEGVEDGNGWVSTINNPSTLNRPIRRARLVLVAPAKLAFGAGMEQLDLDFLAEHRIDRATYEMNIVGKQLSGMQEEVLSITLRQPGLKHAAYQGRLTIWYGPPREEWKLVLKPVFVVVIK